MESLIRWNKKDYNRLRYAINKFNNEISKIEVDEKTILPEMRSYKEVKQNITTRKELNRVINSLRRANLQNLTETRTFESGERVTRWEFNEINKSIRRALKSLESERESILKGRESIGMGDERLSEISAIEESISSISYQTGSDFKRIRGRVYAVGRSDYKMSKDKLFMDNFYKALDDLKSYPNYDKLRSELDRIKNPSKFYEYVKKSPTLMDIFLWYKSDEPVVYGNFDSNEEAFLSTLKNDFGIE